MEVNNTNSVTDSKPEIIYRCKKCRRIVATQENVVTHQPGEGEQCFKWKKRSNSLENNSKPVCSSIFVEPMKWMQAALGQQRSTNCIGLDTAFLALGPQRSRNCIGLSLCACNVNRNMKGRGTVSHFEEGRVEEKLLCLGCKARLGSFNWAGMQCSCGTWVNPAFQLHKSRIDESGI